MLAMVNAVERQKKLEGTVDEKVADGFFSLHCEGEEEPIYISEVVERSSVSFLSPYPTTILKWKGRLLIEYAHHDLELQLSIFRPYKPPPRNYENGRTHIPILHLPTRRLDLPP